jgi:hypothetical protein
LAPSVVVIGIAPGRLPEQQPQPSVSALSIAAALFVP